MGVKNATQQNIASRMLNVQKGPFKQISLPNGNGSRRKNYKKVSDLQISNISKRSKTGKHLKQ